MRIRWYDTDVEAFRSVTFTEGYDGDKWAVTMEGDDGDGFRPLGYMAKDRYKSAEDAMEVAGRIIDKLTENGYIDFRNAYEDYGFVVI